MADTAIKVEHISKKYNLLHKDSSRSDSLMESASVWAKNLVRKGNKRTSTEEFWALRDVSFEIKQGDRVGVIGRNGAGKSTLLKILSRIVLPTEGRIEYEGRIASLLEVGTGFHGDLSGRENIYLNGSILGMSKHEIDRKFDEIVDFAEVERFLDTPVKRYSSGMYVRLAFAVAAHLEPEILIVDEVLAVGDAAFQKKCLGKMEDVSNKDGRTILFVSHNIDAVQKLCNRGVLLNKGQLLEQGPIDQVISSYVSNNALSNGYFEVEKNQVENLSQLGEIISLSILDSKGELVGEVPAGETWTVKFVFRIHREHDSFVAGFGLQSMFGTPLNTSWSMPQRVTPGMYEVYFRNTDVYYNSGQYKISMGLSNDSRSYFYNDSEAFLIISDAGDSYESQRIVNKSSGLLLNQLQVELRKTT